MWSFEQKEEKAENWKLPNEHTRACENVYLRLPFSPFKGRIRVGRPGCITDLVEKSSFAVFLSKMNICQGL